MFMPCFKSRSSIGECFSSFENSLWEARRVEVHRGEA